MAKVRTPRSSLTELGGGQMSDSEPNNVLEDWILENAAEDAGFVNQLPAVAVRLGLASSESDGIDVARASLLELARQGLVNVGPVAGWYPPTGLEFDTLAAALADSDAWAPHSTARQVLEYWASPAGEALNRSRDEAGEPRASA